MAVWLGVSASLTDSNSADVSLESGNTLRSRVFLWMKATPPPLEEAVERSHHVMP